MRTLIINGRLYQDPEQKTTSNGKTFCSFAICDTKKRGNKDDNMWVRVTVFGKMAESCLQYLHAKDYVTVVGDPSIYVSKDGKASIELMANQVEFGPKAGDNGGQQGGYQQQPQGGYQQPPQQGVYYQPQQQGGYQQQPQQTPPPDFNTPAEAQDNGDSPF